MKISFQNKVYEIKSCEKTDIPYCVEKVSKYWKDIDIKQRTVELECCEGIKVVDDTDTIQAFFYWMEDDNPEIIHGEASWFSRKPFAMMMLKCAQDCFPYTQIHFMPHDNGIVPFKWVINPNTIKPAFLFGRTLVINIFSNRVNESMNRYHFKVVE